MLTQVTSGMTDTNAQYYGFKSRIINGQMQIDQRNAGSAVTVNAANIFVVDRFKSTAVSNGWGGTAVFSGQQNKGSVTPPTGFSNYLGLATTTADTSIASNDSYDLVQRIEGFNTADLAWGTANAKTITVSFWVYTNLTGTFGGVILNSAYTRNYPFSYSVTTANTWQQITLTIPGDTTGTWVGATNGIGLTLSWSLGAASGVLSSSPNTWQTAASSGSYAYSGVTGQNQICASTSNYFYLTGVQLEKGTQATSFDYRPYGTELQLCQRYYYQLPPWNSANLPICTTYQRSSTIAIGAMLFPVTMRGIPSINVNSGTAYFHVSVGAGDFDALTVGVEGGTYINKNGVSLTTTFASGSSTVGYAGELYLNAAGSILGFSAEL